MHQMSFVLHHTFQRSHVYTRKISINTHTYEMKRLDWSYSAFAHSPMFLPITYLKGH
ncbi:hypothetical protein HanIR_Chr04g0198561 [Helianthus annuus]|nr:hypothetical protein HanIR_Chr04g0198561 [Helianthus annuus]